MSRSVLLGSILLRNGTTSFVYRSLLPNTSNNARLERSAGVQLVLSVMSRRSLIETRWPRKTRKTGFPSVPGTIEQRVIRGKADCARRYRWSADTRSHVVEPAVSAIVVINYATAAEVQIFFHRSVSFSSALSACESLSRRVFYANRRGYDDRKND